ncbi:MAG TPA: sensor histidine kinase [Rudaea sp.]|jgi:signal transduction histidine kinase
MRPDPGKTTSAAQHLLEDVRRRQQELVARLQGGQESLKRLARSVWRVQEQEQRKLARELHDGIGQNLAALVRLIERAQSAPADAGTQLEQARALAATTLQETRALSRLLRPQILDDLGLGPALHWLARTFTETYAVPVEVEIADSLPPFDDDLATLVFRASQEALANAARHAKATCIRIELQQNPTNLHLSIRDDGRGCNPTQAFAAGSEGRASGLGGMRDRVRLYDGDFRIESAPGAGFAVLIDLPVPANEGHNA